MARNISIATTDDLDGSEGASAVTFGIDGLSYIIDLGQANRAKLEHALAPFMAAGRRSTAGRNRQAGRPAGRRTDGAAVRAWAREAGLTVSERGRIAASVIRQYEATHLSLPRWPR